jgi:hypothetical protein
VPLPGDPLDRWWIEAEQDSQAVTDFKQCILTLLAFGPDKEPKLVGSAFVIGHGEWFALALTAGHVLPLGVHRSQRPTPRHAASSIFVPPSWSEPSLDPKKLMAFWMGPNNGLALNLLHVSYNDGLDLSCFIATPQPTGDFRPAMIPLSIEVPKVGDRVHLVSNDALECVETAPPVDRDGRGHEIQISRRLSARVGIVTGVYPNGFRQYRWPCFTTSIPVRGGMSGGFAYLPREGAPVAACGVVSADHSEPEAHLRFTVAGESVVACAWPALLLSVPPRVSRDEPNPPLKTIYEMMQSGAITPPIGGLEPVELINEPGGGLTMRLHTRPG